MNQRIQQLALECGAWHQVYDEERFMVDSNFDVERFAELIVRECCDIVHSKTDESIRVVMAIEQHFGVES